MPRILSPVVIETKQELLAALKSGALQTSKYNLLKDSEKQFVELIVFGDFTAGEAIRAIDPTCKWPDALGNKMLSNKLVAETLEELSIQRDAKFMAELSSSRDLALAKLKYIMITSKDDALVAACAKTILDKGEKILASHTKDEQVGNVRFNIQVENLNVGGSSPAALGDIIIPISEEEEEVAIAEKLASQGASGVEVERGKDARREKIKAARQKASINPQTGLPYTIVYEGVDSYQKKPPITVEADPVIEEEKDQD